MAGLGCLTACRFIRKLRGGSQPVLIEASDGAYYVLKFRNNPQGANVLFNDSAGTELFSACGLSVAPGKPVVVTASFVDRNPGCWMEAPYEMLRPEPGLCFGSLFLGSQGRRLLEILPGNSYMRVRNRVSFWFAWLLDISCENADNRQAVFQQSADGSLDACFIDMGHFLGGPKGNLNPHFLAAGYLDRRIYPDVTSNQVLEILQVVRELDIERLWRQLRATPAEWQRPSALISLERSLKRIGDLALLQGILEAMLGRHQERGESEPDTTWASNSNLRAILRARLRAARTGGTDHLAPRPAFGACR
jgi:hypothetical protein